MTKLIRFNNNIWYVEYPVSFWGCHFDTRMTLIRLNGGSLFVHSPVPIGDTLTKADISQLGIVRYIVAPRLHNLFFTSFAEEFPDAEKYITPGWTDIDSKSHEKIAIINDNDEFPWQDEIEHLLIQGNEYLNETVFFYKPTRTLIVTDFIEYFTDETPNTNWITRMWMKIFFMWGVPSPSPEFQIYTDNDKIQKSIQLVLEWNASSAIIAHGEIINRDVNSIILKAYKIETSKKSCLIQ